MIQTELGNFPFLQTFIQEVSVIAMEYKNASVTLNELKHFFKDSEMPAVYAHFDYWIKESGFDTEEIGYDARGKTPVGGFPIFKKGFPINWYNVESNFPNIYKMLMAVPGIHFAQFSIMAPGAHILPHKHKITDSRIFHINLFDLDGLAEFSAGNDKVFLHKAGDHFLFNPADLHESKNTSNSYRINLMFDFRL